VVGIFSGDFNLLHRGLHLCLKIFKESQNENSLKNTDLDCYKKAQQRLRHPGYVLLSSRKPFLSGGMNWSQ